MTTQGFIPHMKYKGIELPVKLKITNPSEKDLHGDFPPMKDREEYVYVLPGGFLLCR